MWGVSTRFQAVAGGSRALQGPPRGSRGLQKPSGALGTFSRTVPTKNVPAAYRQISCGMVGLDYATHHGGGGGGQAEACLQGGVEGVFKGI